MVYELYYLNNNNTPLFNIIILNSVMHKRLKLKLEVHIRCKNEVSNKQTTNRPTRTTQFYKY